MLGAICGDIIGSVYEFAAIKTTDFPLFDPECRFTDDTVLTVAVAEHLLDGVDLVGAFHRMVDRYPRAGYGGRFGRWAHGRERAPYHSLGNGSAMRVAPVAWARDTLVEVLATAEATAAVTHNHPEGIEAARMVAGAIFLGRNGASQAEIRTWVVAHSRYPLERSLAEIRPAYRFEVTAARSVPEAIQAFLEADSVETAIRNAISLGGDADTQACIAGALAEGCFGGVPPALANPALDHLDEHLLGHVERFRERFAVP